MDDQWKFELLQQLKNSQVADDPQHLSIANTATFATQAKSQLIVQPFTTEDISIVLKFAIQKNLKVYPISQGKNWGFGSKVPVLSNYILLDLSSMNKILDYDPQFGTVSIEPGVSFSQLSNFLRKNGNRHFLNIIGGDGGASVLGNILERGDGLGPYCERSEFACNLEVMLADGSLHSIGNKNIKGAQTQHLQKTSLGPGFQELFFQSNYGVVTKITIWLNQIPKHFRAFQFYLKEENHLASVIDRLKILYAKRIVQSPITFWNDYKQLVNHSQYPWSLQNEKVPLTRVTLQSMSDKYSPWLGFGGIYTDHHKISRAIEKAIFAQLKPFLHKPHFHHRLSNRKIKRLQWISRIVNWKRYHALFQSWNNNPLLGHVTSVGTQSLFWRKRKAIPDKIHPEQDHCGVLWHTFILPMDGSSVVSTFQTLDQVLFHHKLEPVISFVTLNDRYIKVFLQILFDREEDGADKNALLCHQRLLDTLLTLGFPPTRLDVLSMAKLDQIYINQALHHNIKMALDPSHVISPGRYISLLGKDR